MTLDENKINELRVSLQELLNDVPEGERIKLNKELLEQLIFDAYVEKREMDDKNISDVLVKYVVWSGPFLRKLDLSEVSFDNVMWQIDYDSEQFFERGSTNRYIEKGIKEIDLSGTNAVINFNKIIKNFTTYIAYCNFSGVDLSNNCLSNFYIENCVFDNTGIRLSFDCDECALVRSSFRNVDLSYLTVDEINFGFPGDYEEHSIYCTDLTNTGIRIRVSEVEDEIKDKYKRMKEIEANCERMKMRNYFKDKEYCQLFANISLRDRGRIEGAKYLDEFIDGGYLEGCYINSKKVNSVKKNNEFNLVNSIIEDVQGQIGDLKKR